MEMASELKKRSGVLIKIDTNGYNPSLLEKIISEGLADFIAMDIKTSLKKYYIAAGVGINEDMIKSSIDLLIGSNVMYEFRTTAVPGIVTSDDIREIGALVNGAKKYALQQFRSERVLSDEFTGLKPYKPEEIRKFKDILLQFVQNVEIRGI